MDEDTLDHLWRLNLQDQANLADRGFSKWLKALMPHSWAATKYSLLESQLEAYRPDGSDVITTDRLTTAALTRLFETHRSCALHVRGFCAHDVSERLSTLASTESTQWMLEGNIATDMFYAGGSVPREVAKRSRANFNRYFSEAECFVARQRALSRGHWPVDHLLRELKELWPGGAHLADWHGYTVRPAIMRVMQGGGASSLHTPAHGMGFIHTDGPLVYKPQQGLFSANIYHQLPKSGGRLFVWGVNLTEVTSLRDALRVEALTCMDGKLFDLQWQMRLHKLLPSPHIIEPRVGDLVLINTGRPHSVEPVQTGIRVTNQLFIKANGAAGLTLMS